MVQIRFRTPFLPRSPALTIIVAALCVVGFLAEMWLTSTSRHNGGTASHGGTAPSRIRLALPGASVAVPVHWAKLPQPASEHTVAAAPKLQPPCPNSLYGGPSACQDAVALGAVAGSSPEQALASKAQTRFTAMRSYIVAKAMLRTSAVTVGGCPARETEWLVTWTQPPATIEELVVLRTGVPYAGSDLESVFIRAADTPAAPAQPLIDAIAASIRCQA